ncbi:MAG TPA: galactose oxidase early set domain-containing protein, partial [Nitrososphaera sp.]|nr:galactose oxidase early set domain-containing protein [Nitrososphaera sp.]
YGNSFESRTHDASQIRAVALMRPSATTHCVDTEQRYVGLDFDVKKGKIVAVAPGNPNIAPPGYYMLFIIDEEGIPSRANFLHLS